MTKGFDNEDFDVENDLTVGNDATVSGAANVTGAVGGGAGSNFTDSNIVNYKAFTPTVAAPLEASVNDYAISTATLNMISSDGLATYNITGIVSGVPGQLCMICHTGGDVINLMNENASSSAANRILTGTGADLALGPDQSVMLVYDDTATRWRVFKNA